MPIGWSRGLRERPRSAPQRTRDGPYYQRSGHQDLSAILLGCGAGALFAAGTVAIRHAFSAVPDPALCAAVATTVGFFVVLLAAACTAGGGHRIDVGQLWPFALAGLLAPGASNILFTAAVHAAGPSRVSVIVGTAPLFAVVIAIIFLGEPIVTGVAIGALLIVGGGITFTGERDRPTDFRGVGVFLAIAATVLFASRDNLVRWLDGSSTVAALPAAAAAIFAAATFNIAYRATVGGPLRWGQVRRGVVAFGLPGILSGLSNICLFEALERGRVSVVNPLVATESLWGVAFSVLVFGSRELIGRRLMLGALLVVAGGALIGATRH